MVCKGICVNYQIEKAYRNLGIYEKGVKSCSFCKKYLKWFNQRCPCCKNILDSKTRKTTKVNQRHQSFIYKKFQLKLKLSKKIVDDAKKLEDDLMKKVNLDISPEVRATTCIYLLNHIEKPKSLEEILDVFKIPEVEVRYYMAKISEKVSAPLE